MYLNLFTFFIVFVAFLRCLNQTAASLFSCLPSSLQIGIWRCYYTHKQTWFLCVRTFFSYLQINDDDVRSCWRCDVSFAWGDVSAGKALGAARKVVWCFRGEPCVSYRLHTAHTFIHALHTICGWAFWGESEKLESKSLRLDCEHVKIFRALCSSSRLRGSTLSDVFFIQWNKKKE